MGSYEILLAECNELGLKVKECPLIYNDGRIKGDKILIRQDMTDAEKACVLAEELGHYCTSVGDIIDQSYIVNRKQERQARLWGYNRLIGLEGIVQAYKSGCQSLHEAAEHLDVTVEYLKECIEAYRSKYGTYVKHGDYYIYFEPFLAVAEKEI